jgi:hypothetical protein
MVSSVTEGVRDSVLNGLAWGVFVSFTIGPGDSRYIGFLTGDYAVALEARTLTSTGEDTLFALYENETYSGGAAIEMQCRNRYHSVDTQLNPVVEVKDDVAASPTSAVITAARLLYTNKGVASSAAGPDADQFILLANTPHILAVTNSDLQSATISIRALVRREVFIA